MAILKSHETAALWTVFDEVYDRGAAFSLKARFRRWFDTNHFSVQVRRDLRSQWSEYLSERGITDEPRLRIGEIGENVILARGDVFFKDSE
jgi:hypothetical protein